MIAEQDEFEKHARAALRNAPRLVDRLLVLRKQIQEEGERAWSKSRPPTASMLNASNRRMIDQAASLLGKSNFERVFGFSPDQQFNLVDPELMRSQAPGRKKQVPKTAVSRVTRPSSAAHVVTLKHLAAAIADEQELSKKQAELILNDLVGRITKHLKKGERIRIVGLGILQVRKRAARMGRNPATGEAIRIKASKKVAFRAAKDLKEAI
jgi:DNA-binding protein HU-beta